MKKNNKGFTLIELLAAVVVLGILLMVTIPLVTKNITFGRNKTYVQDANKLIALAEYRLNSNSLKIEKPDPNNCIILGFDYLNDGSIANPPNGGTYNGDVSFVVVKNNNGKLEYAVSLIEEMKNNGGYSGVTLSTESQLNSSRVKGLTENDMIYLSQDLCNKYGVNRDRSVYNSDLINSSIGINNYVDTVEKVYLGDRLEQGEPGNAAAPKIKKSYVEFDHNVLEVNEVGFIVYVNAVDKDSDNLTICIKDSEDKNDTYPDKDNNCDNTYSGSDYFKNFKYTISKEEEDRGVTKYFYVSVYDDDNNVSNTKFEKTITNNMAPEIRISVSKRDTDKVNTHIARIKLEKVEDDRARKEYLQYCINQSSTCDSADYKSYSELFNSNGEYDYTISDNGIKLTRPKEGSYKIYAHVRDSYGEIGDSGPITFDVPSLTAPAVHYEVYPNSKYGKNDITGLLKLHVTDNYSTDDNITVNVNVEGASNRRTLSYKNYIENPTNWNYTLDTGYNKSSYTIKLEVSNEYGATSTEMIPINNVYRNRAPEIKSFDISGLGYTACSDNVISASFSMSDDLDNSYSYCLTADENGCSDVSDYTTTNRSDVSTDYTIPKNLSECSDVYINNGREITLKVRDSYGKTVERKANYSALNLPPSISGIFSINSTNAEGKNKENVRIDVSSIDVQDDKSDYRLSLCYKINDSDIDDDSNDDDIILNNSLSEDAVCFKNNIDDSDRRNTIYFSNDEFSSNFSNDVDLLDKNGAIIPSDGKKLTAYVIATDSSGVMAQSDPVNYTLYDDNIPRIVDIYKYLGVIEDDDVSDTQTTTTSTQESENNILSIYFKVYDPEDTYNYCIDDNSSNDGCSYDSDKAIAASNNDDKDDTFSFDDYVLYKYNIDGTPKKESLYLHIVDSEGNKVTKSIYERCSEYGSLGENDFIRYDPVDHNVISNAYCEKQCYTQKDKAVQYFKKYSFTDILGTSCQNAIDEKVTLNCDYYTCIGNDSEVEYEVYGKVKMYSPKQIVINMNEETYQCNDYYYKYTAKIFGDYVGFFRSTIDDKVCANVVDNGNYTRIDDSDYISEYMCLNEINVSDDKVHVYFFGDGFEDTEAAKEWFKSIEGTYGSKFEIIDYDYNDVTSELVQMIARALGEGGPGTSLPYIIIGNQSWIGFNDDYKNQIISKINTEYAKEDRYDVMEHTSYTCVRGNTIEK